MGMSKAGSLRAPAAGSPGGERWRSAGRGPEAGQGCAVSQLDFPTLKLSSSSPDIHHCCCFFSPLWSLDVSAGKNLTRKQMQGREILMFGSLRKWLPRQQGARERTSLLTDSIGDIQAVPQTENVVQSQSSCVGPE